MSAIAGKIVNKVLKNKMSQQAPEDPHYAYAVDARGKKKKHVRPLPEGLSKRDKKILKKVRRRAHYLDKGMNLCGFRVGWTFLIGIIPGLGDAVDASLNYFLIVRPAKKVDIPTSLLQKMLFNNAISAGLGLVPIAGDIFLAAWKANSRNALLLEAYLTIRGEEYLAAMRNGTGPIGAQEAIAYGIAPEDLQEQFAPGAGMNEVVEDDSESNVGIVGGKSKHSKKKNGRK